MMTGSVDRNVGQIVVFFTRLAVGALLPLAQHMHVHV